MGLSYVGDCLQANIRVGQCRAEQTNRREGKGSTKWVQV